MNYNSLLSDTEFSENRVQDVLDIHSAEQTAERLRCCSQFLCRQFVATSGNSQAASQRLGRLPQQLPLPLPTDQAIFTRSEKILRKNSQRRHQFRNAIAAARGNPEGRFVVRLR